MKRKMLQKFGASMLTMTMAAGLLAGCGNQAQETDVTQSGAKENSAEESGQETPASDSAEQTAAESGSDVWEGEVTKIIMTYPTGGVEPTDMLLVQDAINEISVKEAGVEIEFKPVSIFDIPSTCPMWIGGGEQIDLMAVAFTSLEPYITQNMIQPLDQWKELAPAAWELAETYPLFDINNTGSVYGMGPTAPLVGKAGGYLIAVEDLEAANLSYEDGQMITLDELGEIFAAIKAAKPDVTPCGVTGAADRADFTFVCDPLGVSLVTGVLMGLDSTEVVNVYATPEYKSYLEHVRSWYEKGYILKDAATSDISMDDLSVSGALSGYFSSAEAGQRNTLENKTGREYIRLMFVEPYRPADSGTVGCYYTVPVTAKEPEAAMRFMNLMYKDSRLANLLIWGIEGKHYVVTDEETGVIAYPEGVDASNNTYSYGLGLYGNQLNVYTMGQSTKAEDEVWTATAMKRQTKGYGFCYDASAMTNQIIAVEAVVKEYTPALTTGSAELETTYAEFLRKLEDNGINEIIADKQAQFDAWLAEQ